MLDDDYPDTVVSGEALNTLIDIWPIYVALRYIVLWSKMKNSPVSAEDYRSAGTLRRGTDVFRATVVAISAHNKGAQLVPEALPVLALDPKVERISVFHMRPGVHLEATIRLDGFQHRFRLA